MYILQVRRVAGKILLLRFSKMQRTCAVQFVEGIGVRPRFAFKEFSWLLFCSLKRELSEEWCVVRRLFFLSLILVV